MRRLFAIFLALFPLLCFSQEYGYTRYDSKDGLPSSTVYCTTQDADGFMWFGTETGLSRFDGTHFRTFTLDDGLPDNEIIQLFTDSRGRIWISPFKKTICYYYKGKIYTQENDTLLQHIAINSNVMRFAENDRGDVLLMETSQLHLVTAANEVYTVNTIQGEPVKYLSAVGRDPAGNFWVLESNRLYEYSNRLFNLERTLDYTSEHISFAAVDKHVIALRNDFARFSIQSVVTGKTFYFPRKSIITNFSIIDDDHIGVNSAEGALVYNINYPDSVQHFLPGVRVCGIKKDNEGSLWFTTLGQGVYRLNSAFVLNTKFQDYNTNHQVLSFARIGDSVVVGCDMNVLYRLNVNTGQHGGKTVFPLMEKAHPVVALSKTGDEPLIAGTPQGIYQFEPHFYWYMRLSFITAKSFYRYKNDLLVITDKNIFRLNPVTMTIRDTIWHERATAAYAVNDTLYVGTLNGLYRLLPDGDKQFLGAAFAPFKTRIAAITRDTNR